MFTAILVLVFFGLGFGAGRIHNKAAAEAKFKADVAAIKAKL
jgi:hypothetical protein